MSTTGYWNFSQSTTTIPTKITGGDGPAEDADALGNAEGEAEASETLLPAEGLGEAAGETEGPKDETNRLDGETPAEGETPTDAAPGDGEADGDTPGEGDGARLDRGDAEGEAKTLLRPPGG